MDALFTAISEHISFLGYTTPQIPNLPADAPEIINAMHPSKPRFWVLPIAGGAFFRALYNLASDTPRDPSAFLTFMNDLNTAACLGHYYILDKYFCVGAWYYGEYNRIQFGIFLDRYLFENTLPYLQFKQRAELYLGPSHYT